MLRNTSNLSIFQPDGFLFFKQAGRSSGRVRPPGLFLLGLSKAVALTAGRDHKKALSKDRSLNGPALKMSVLKNWRVLTL